MRPVRFSVGDWDVLAWDAAQELTGRSAATYDAEADEVTVDWHPGRSIRFATFIAIPRLGVLAVSDRAGDHFLSAKAGISRFKAVFRSMVEEGEADIMLAASHADVRRALGEWSLSRFSFTVRPFNPHPSDPGRTLSDLFDRDGIGKVTGRAEAAPGKIMQMHSGGYIEETLGLTEKGYGQVGVEGETPSGRRASVAKPSFSPERKTNEKRQTEPQVLRVFVDVKDNRAEEAEEAARALLEFYDPGEKSE
jgi:hypothetical protein